MFRRSSTTVKSPGRKRRVAGWLLLVVGVLIAGVWGASRWWCPVANWRGWSISCTGGMLMLNRHSDDGTPRSFGMNVFASPEPAGGRRWYWGVPSHNGGEGNWRCWPAAHLAMPGLDGWFFYGWVVILWPFALASLLGGGWLVWSGRRARRRAMVGGGVCRKCGYNLAGLAAGAPCPECGGEVGDACKARSV